MGIVTKLLGNKPKKPEDWPWSYADHRDDLVKAAGVGVAKVRCHGNTWTYLETYVPKTSKTSVRDGASAEAFNPPEADEVTTEEDGMVTVPLSGTTLAAVLSWCRDIQGETFDWGAVDQAIGRRVGFAISDALTGLVSAPGQGGPHAFIYLDDRIAEKETAT